MEKPKNYHTLRCGLFNLYVCIYLVVFTGSIVSAYDNIQSVCPQLYRKKFGGYVPRGNLSAGIFEEIEDVSNLSTCVMRCCMNKKCNVAFMSSEKCYHIQCIRDDLCLPTSKFGPGSSEHEVAMVLVKPVDHPSWDSVLESLDLSTEVQDQESYRTFGEPSKFQDVYDFLMGESCNVDSENSCMVNEVCVVTSSKSATGLCLCKDGYTRNRDGVCVSLDVDDFTVPIGITEKILRSKGITDSPNKKTLQLTALSKVVKLPENEVTLVASVSPTVPDRKIQFQWTSLEQPKGSAAVKHQHDGQLHLSKLTEGLYTFKVAAVSPDAYGEAFVNVSVLPPSRINTPPRIVITPSDQTIKQPNSAAVLDASSSTDDDGIVSWHWELQQGPLGYQPVLQDSPTLQLYDLTKPGNYSFRLTVTDTDKSSSSSTANITVLKNTDYPPEANAGEDKVIYLPHNKITLNGNLSTDDHAITTWEWTKSADDAQKAVDMQDTRTPYLQLSNLEEGIYTFTLKVTDSANQNSTAQVHVFVKPPTNQPPNAEAGPNVTISLPQTWAVLDGSSSKDDNKIVEYGWTQIEGPNTAVIVPQNGSKVNVTGLTKGKYVFNITVMDDNNNTASDSVFVTVNQNQNQKPVAVAGKNFDVELPCNLVTLNGSESKDDLAVVKWRWSRSSNSSAMGKIVPKSDETAVLMITDLTVGRYIFNLTVYDEQGLFDYDTVTFTVKQDPKLLHLVDITVDVLAEYLTNDLYDVLLGKITLLLGDEFKLQVRNLKPDDRTKKIVITFYVEASNGDALPANTVVHHLRQKLHVDASILGFPVVRLRTAVCQNNCSGHGFCDEETRICRCETFWMRNMFRMYLMPDEDSDCNWSIFYVVLGFMSFLLLLTASLWFLTYICYKWCSRHFTATKSTTYKLIEDTDDLLPPSALRKSTQLSDSDTDLDVVFESRQKSLSRGHDSRHSHKTYRNGMAKAGRRIKA